MKNRALWLRILEIYDTQDNFAREMGIDRATVSRVVNGDNVLNDTQKKEWASKLKTISRVIFPPVEEVTAGVKHEIAHITPEE